MSSIIKILVLAANPWDTKRISPDEEYREIQKVLNASKQRDDFILKYAPASSDAELRQALLDFEPNIVHFSGHGEIDGLCFQNATGNTQFISKEALIRLFGLFANQVNCVVLNACYSEEQAQAIAQHIEHVIGMNKAIGDMAAIKFATGFYQALFNGKDIDFSFKFGCSAIDLSAISEWQTPQLKKKYTSVANFNSPPKNFLSNYQYDVLIQAATTEKSWVDGFIYELQKYLTQKLDNQSCHIQLYTDESDFEKSATVLLVLSAHYVNEYQATVSQLEKYSSQKRLFLAEYSAVLRPEALRGLLSYSFWKADPHTGLRCMDKSDPDYFLQIENMANDIASRLKQLKNEAKTKTEFTAIRSSISSELNNQVVFVNVDPEDSNLTEQIQSSLENYGLGYAFPAVTNSSSEIRTDLENKLLQCDAVLLIYERGAPSWIDFQLLTCSRCLRKREEPFKIVAVYTEEHKSKFNVHLPNLNLQVFYCHPEEIENYLPLFMKELK